MMLEFDKIEQKIKDIRNINHSDDGKVNVEKFVIIEDEDSAIDTTKLVSDGNELVNGYY